MFVYGETTKRQDLLRRVGNIRQLCDVRRVTIGEGKADGLRAFEMHNAAGLEMTIIESRCLDIYDFKYKGINIPFMAKPGLVGAQHADLHGKNFLRSVGGGMLYTCGLSNVGKECSDNDGDHIFHGRVRFIPAENTSASVKWQDGTYKLCVRGEMRDTALFGENLLMERVISTEIDAKSFTISDTIENQGFESQKLMLMYHMNFGYPLIDAGIRVYIPSEEVCPMNPASEKDEALWKDIVPPVDGYEENVFVHRLKPHEGGKATAGFYNHRIGMGVAISFDTAVLPKLVQWKSMRSGDYVLGLHPSNCFGNGRDYEREMGGPDVIAPFESKRFNITVTVLDGEEDAKRLFVF